VKLAGEVGDLDDVARLDRNAVGDLGDAGIAGRAVDLLDERAAVERPRERVLAPSAADDEDFHAATF